MLSPEILRVLGIVSCIWIAYKLLRPTQRTRPPGPRPLPLLGNLLDMPKSKQWLTFAEWSKKYGDIVSVTAFGQTVISLSSSEDVKELFVNRASNYSNRSQLIMAELVGWKDGVGTVSPGEKFRAMRRFMTQMMGPQAAKNPSFIEAQDSIIAGTLRRIVQSSPNSGNLKAHLERMSVSIILRLTYGYDVKDDNDSFIRRAVDTLAVFQAIMQPGWVVDSFPILRHIPSWFPFAYFKRKAKIWRQTVEGSRKVYLQWTKDQIESGTAQPSFAADLLEDQERMRDEILFSTVLGDVLGAGTDTSMTAGAKLFLALALHPDVQAKAQDEIDRVTSGGTRLPVYADKEQLPYLDALIKEVLRWNTPVAPLGVPHCAAEEDEYNGYYIPKGAILFANIWSMFENPKYYPEPGLFKPERFIDNKSQPETVNEDPMHIAFGFGARVCPGRHLAENTQWLLTAKLLATCTVSDARDASTGQPLTKTNVTYLHGLVSEPIPFTCKVVPRSVAAERLLFEAP